MLKLVYIAACGAIVLFITTASYAQETIPASGGDASGVGGSVSYTVGQVAYTTNIGLGNSIGEGVQQPYEISAITGIEVPGIDLELIVFPNPTQNILTLQMSEINKEDLSYLLFNMHGKVLQNRLITSNTETIVMEGLPQATFILQVRRKQEVVKTFQIIKN